MWKYIFTIFCIFWTMPLWAQHYPEAPFSPIQMHMAGCVTIQGIPASPGDEVALFDKTGTLVGSAVVTTEGLYGDLAVFGDVILTPEREGASPDEILTVRVRQQSTGKEYAAITLAPPSQSMGIYAPMREKTIRFREGYFLSVNVDASDQEGRP